jgi:hypothetical protein
MLILGVSIVAAQEQDCPSIVRAAVEAAGSACDDIGRNQACYGNINLQATPRGDVANFTFGVPGDLVDISTLQALQLSAMNIEDSSWGVALMKVQANLPDTLPGQNVTLVLFGDVEVQNRGGESILFNITATANVNVRKSPSTEVEIVNSLPNGQSALADGRNDEGDWLHVRLDDGSVGWIFSELVHMDGNAAALPLIDDARESTDAPQYGPMQAFYFKSGISDAPCSEAPGSGVLIQSPQGTGRVTIVVNEIRIDLGSTIFLQGCPCHGLDVDVIEGNATVTVAGVTRNVPAGATVHIPLDENGDPDGEPEVINAYAPEREQFLPITLLAEQITIAAPLTESELEAARES